MARVKISPSYGSNGTIDCDGDNSWTGGNGWRSDDPLEETRHVGILFRAQFVSKTDVFDLSWRGRGERKVVDWPTSVQMFNVADSGWNFFFTGWGTQPALGALATMQFLADPNAAYRPKGDKGDPELLAAWADMNALPDAKDRQAAFAKMQKIALEKVLALPFGSFTKVQGARSNVKGFVPFRIPRMSNVWFTN